MFSLTTTHLSFVCEATTPLRLEVDTYRAGSDLRGALGQVMQRTYCAHDPQLHPSLSLLRGAGKEERAASCPVCWLLSANEHPGVERRGYALVPPVSEPATGCLKPGERFEFGLTLFGRALQFLPYFVLAVPEMGRLGIGPGRGKFTLKSLWAMNPFSGNRECLMAEGTNLVHTPTLTLDHAQVEQEAERLMQSVIANETRQSPRSDSEIASPPSARLAMTNRIEIRFVTPMRLIVNDALCKTPAFDVLFARLLKRLDELEMQFGKEEGNSQLPTHKSQLPTLKSQLPTLKSQITISKSQLPIPKYQIPKNEGEEKSQLSNLKYQIPKEEREGGNGGRSLEEVQALHALAQRVELVEDETRWVEVWSGSTRRGKPSPLSGLVGRAVYAAPPDVWQQLLPWLLWGELAQVGKDTVKGNGVIDVWRLYSISSWKNSARSSASTASA